MSSPEMKNISLFQKGKSGLYRMCHPPVGLNLYVASGIAKMGITELTIAVWPWLLTM